MLQDGLFERFPCDSVFGMHNRPDLPIGKFAIRPGPIMAGGASFDITVTGKGSHGARPEEGIDPVLTACHVTTALQAIVSRNIRPADTAVLSVTTIQAGDAYNVIPQTAVIRGTFRTFSNDTMKQIEDCMRRTVMGIAAAFGATATLDFPDVRIDTNSAAGELVFHVFGAIAHFERRLIAERTKDGIAAARARGKRPGRRPLDPEKIAAALGLVEAGLSPTVAARQLGLGRSTVYREVGRAGIAR
jgi:amidohydrolase